jgi:hypothetical protein
MNRLMQQKLAQRQLEQQGKHFQQELQQRNEHFYPQLELQQQAGQRAEKLINPQIEHMNAQNAGIYGNLAIDKQKLALMQQKMPYEIMEVMNKAQGLKNQAALYEQQAILVPAHAEAYRAQARQANAQADNLIAFTGMFNQGMPGQSAESQSANPQNPQMGQIANGMINQTPQQNMGQAPHHSLGARPNAQPQQPIAAPALPANMMPPQFANQAIQPQQVAQEGNFNPSEMPYGQEMLIRPPTPGREKLDNIAGINMPGAINAAPIQTKTENGVQYKTYPSGKVTAMKVAPSGAEKAALETEKKGTQKQQQLRIKEAETIKKELPVAEKYVADADRLLELMDETAQDYGNVWWGKRVPIGSQELQEYMREQGINDPRFGEMQSIMLRMAIPMSQEFSTKGLASGLHAALQSKPGFYENYKNSRGKAEKLAKDLKHTVEKERNRLKEIAPDQYQEQRRPIAQGTLNGQTVYQFDDGWYDNPEGT